MKVVKAFADWLRGLAEPREPLGSSLIHAISRLPIHLTADAVCLRRNSDSGVLEVLLTQRGGSAPDAEEWCCPGDVLAPGEQPERVLDRLGVTMSDFTFLGDYFSAAAQGWMLSRVHQAKLAAVPATGTWWPVEELPNNTAPKHREQVIPMAVKVFHAQRARLSQKTSAPAV